MSKMNDVSSSTSGTTYPAPMIIDSKSDTVPMQKQVATPSKPPRLEGMVIDEVPINIDQDGRVSSGGVPYSAIVPASGSGVTGMSATDSPDYSIGLIKTRGTLPGNNDNILGKKMLPYDDSTKVNSQNLLTLTGRGTAQQIADDMAYLTDNWERGFPEEVVLADVPMQDPKILELERVLGQLSVSFYETVNSKGKCTSPSVEGPTSEGLTYKFIVGSRKKSEEIVYIITRNLSEGLAMQRTVNLGELSQEARIKTLAFERLASEKIEKKTGLETTVLGYN